MRAFPTLHVGANKHRKWPARGHSYGRQVSLIYYVSLKLWTFSLGAKKKQSLIGPENSQSLFFPHDRCHRSSEWGQLPGNQSEGWGEPWNLPAGNESQILCLLPFRQEWKSSKQMAVTPPLTPDLGGLQFLQDFKTISNCCKSFLKTLQ